MCKVSCKENQVSFEENYSVKASLYKLRLFNFGAVHARRMATGNKSPVNSIF